MAATQSEPAKKAATERSKQLNKAYGAATAKLREAHAEEFEKLYVQAAKDLGVDYTPKPNREQKAREQMSELLREFPKLADELLTQQ